MKRLLTYMILLICCCIDSSADYHITVRRISTKDGLPSNVIKSIYQDRQGFMVISTENGVSRFDGYKCQNMKSVSNVPPKSNNTFKLHDAVWKYDGGGVMSRNGKRYTLIPANIISYTRNAHFFAADVNENTEAVSAYGNGLFLYDKRSGKMTHIGKEHLASEYITWMTVDRTGGIWLAEDFLGVECVRIGTLNYHIKKIADSDTPERNYIRCMQMVAPNRMIIGNQRSEVFTENLTDNGMPGTISELTILPHKLYSVYVDEAGRQWWGTRGSGVYVDGKPDGSAMNVYKIVGDGKGGIWMATLDNGLIHRDKNEKQTAFLRNMKLHDVVCHGSVVLVASETGLCVMNRDNPHQVLSQERGYFFCLYLDSKGHFWAGTNGDGLLSFTITQGKMTDRHYYTMDDGLSSNTVYCIVEDKKGTVWVGTEEGVSSIGNTISSYIIPDDKLSNVFTERAAIRLPDGMLCFGTHNGLLEIDPEDSGAGKGYSSTPAITSIMVNNNAISCHVSSLSNNECNITFHFSDFTYRHSGNSLYQYRLRGYEDSWSKPSTVPFAQYRNIPPGDYIFEVKGLRGSIATYSFTINEPWWNTWWAWTIYAILLVSITSISTSVLRRFVMLRNNLSVERRVSKLQKEFYERVTRELRSPVNVLQGASEKVQISGNTKTTVLSLRRGSRRILKLIDMINNFNHMNHIEMELKAEEGSIAEETERQIKDVIQSVHADEKEFREMAPPPINRQTIMIVEGDIDNMTHLTDTLNPYFTIIQCGSLQECEATTLSNDISLILMDVTNDTHEALTLTRRLATNISIIHFSTYQDEQHHLQSLQSGALDFISLPVGSKILLERIKNVLYASSKKEMDIQTTSPLTGGLEDVPLISDVSDSKFLSKAMTLLKTHISEENFSVEQWAQMMELGRSQFHKRIKELSGQTPVQHVQKAKLEYAAELLRATSMTIEAIMLNTGYHNASYFYNTFRKHFGISPKEYRFGGG